MKNECSIVRDLLPLVEEELVSRETAEFVEKHIGGCDACKAERDRLKSDDIGKIISRDEAGEDAVNLKKLKRKLNMRKVIVGFMSSLVTAAVLLGLGYFLLIGGYPADRDNFEIYTEFQYNEDAYLNQEFVIHITRKDGKPLWSTNRDVYEKDENGNEICVRSEETIKETPILLVPNPAGATAGYFYPGNDAPPEDFDQIVVYKFADGEEIEFSMREVGLYEPQEDVSDGSKYIWTDMGLMTKEEYYESAKELYENAKQMYEEVK